MSNFYTANAILIIKNYIFEVCVKRKINPQKQSDLGLADLRLSFVGNMVNSSISGKPQLFPDDIEVGNRGEISIDSGGIQGEFIIEDIHRTRFKAVEQSLGQFFSGFLIPNKPYIESDWN